MVALKEHFGAYDSNLSLGHALPYLNIWAQFLFRHHAAPAIELMSFMLALFKLRSPLRPTGILDIGELMARIKKVLQQNWTHMGQCNNELV